MSPVLGIETERFTDRRTGERMRKVIGMYLSNASHVRSKPAWAAVMAWTAALWAHEAPAQDDFNATDVAAARVLAIEGIKLADAGRCDEAVDKLARAEKLHHALVVLGRLGECQINQGKLVEGTENLRKVLREVLPPDAPVVLSKARERAQLVFDKAKGRIGALYISVKGPRDPASLSVSVDGEPMNVVLLEADRPTDPGEHLVEVSAPGFISAAGRVNVGAGAKANVVINLEPDPRAQITINSRAVTSIAGSPAASNVDGTVEPAPRAAELSTQDGATALGNDWSAEPDQTAAYVAWTAGGVGVIAGSIFGLLALKGKNDLDSECPNNLCPASSQDRLDSARLSSTLATVSFAVGAAGIGLGTYFYFAAEPSEEGSTASDDAASASSRSRVSAGAWIGLGQVGLAGQF